VTTGRHAGGRGSASCAPFSPDSAICRARVGNRVSPWWGEARVAVEPRSPRARTPICGHANGRSEVPGMGAHSGRPVPSVRSRGAMPGFPQGHRVNPRSCLPEGTAIDMINSPATEGARLHVRARGPQWLARAREACADGSARRRAAATPTSICLGPYGRRLAQQGCSFCTPDATDCGLGASRGYGATVGDYFGTETARIVVVHRTVGHTECGESAPRIRRRQPDKVLRWMTICGACNPAFSGLLGAGRSPELRGDNSLASPRVFAMTLPTMSARVPYPVVARAQTSERIATVPRAGHLRSGGRVGCAKCHC
jgi:hypothetical protein